jgi:hypothetical protein
MSSARDNYIDNLNSHLAGGLLSEKDVARAIAEFDAFEASKRTQVYAVVSTVVAAISAIASAFSAYFAYLGTVAHH